MVSRLKWEDGQTTTAAPSQLPEINLALEAIEKLQKNADTLIMIPNDRLLDIAKLCNENSMSFARAVAELDCAVIIMLFESYCVEKYCDLHIDSTTFLLRYLKYRAPNPG
ncbi:hypothetical protein Vadar_019194 [Vaccinium darrowii]|nr:hypothetical protein Vadar_019194 [Vaccinium darrowii]